MSPILIVVLLAAIGLVIVLLVQWRRPRTAEEELGGLPRVSAPQTTSTPDPASVSEVIKRIARDRATGMLTVSSSDQSCSMAFLFGHLFHAASGTVEGEQAVRTALSWTDAHCHFDPTTKLPGKETITRPISALIS
jgi:hypothetical protein